MTCMTGKMTEEQLHAKIASLTAEKMDLLALNRLQLLTGWAVAVRRVDLLLTLLQGPWVTSRLQVEEGNITGVWVRGKELITLDCWTNGYAATLRVEGREIAPSRNHESPEEALLALFSDPKFITAMTGVQL